MFKWTPNSIRILKTTDLYLLYFNLGLCLSVPGPCLLDLQKLVHTDTQNIAFIYTARSVGYLVGSVCAGIILDLVKSKLAVMTFFSFLVAASMLAIPWSANLPSLTGSMVVNGASLGVVDIGCNVVCLTLWGDESGPYYQALHFMFGLGGLVSPLIAAPFLSEEASMSPATYLNQTSESFNFSTRSFIHYYNSTSAPPADDTTYIVYPFTIIGAFATMVAVLLLAICIISPTEEKRSGSARSKDNKLNPGLLCVLICLNFLLFLVETGTEVGYAQMLTAYVVKGRLKLPSATGSYMTSSFWASFTMARLASVFLALKVSSLTLMMYDLAITLVGSLILLFLSSYEWAMWLASVILGAGISSVFPTAIAWLDSYINVTNKIASVFIAGAALGEMLVPFTISYFIDVFPDVLVYVVLVSCLSTSFMVFILYMILRKRPRKSADEKQQEPKCSVISVPTVNT